MNSLLLRAIDRAAQLPDEEQVRLAELLLADLGEESENEPLALTTPRLREMIAAARRESAAGLTRPLDELLD